MNGGGLLNTLQNIDVLDGGAGVDTLKVTLNEAAAVAATLKNIENVGVRFTKAGADLSLANATGVQSVVVAGSATAGQVSSVGAVANLGVANQNQDVTFVGNTATTLNLALDTVSTATAPVTVTVDNKATTLNLDVNNAADVTLAGTGLVKTLSIDAEGTNKLTMPSVAETLTVEGSGSINLVTAFTTLKTLDASANEGGVTATVDAKAVSVTGGSGNDSITYTAAIAATAKIDLGAGNDTLTLGAASAKGAAINGGDGVNTLAVSNGAWLDANAKTVYQNFQTLEVGKGTGTYDMTNLASLNAVTVGAALSAATTIANAAADTTLAINAKGADLATGFGITYGLKDFAGKSDSLSVSLNGTEGKVANGTADGNITVTGLTANGIETFNIDSSITGIESTLKNTDYTHTITSLDGDALQTLNITGNANLTVTTLAATTVTKIDAHAATGKISIDASSVAQSVEFLGGAANDTYVSSAFGDTVNGGKGSDSINLTASAATVDTLIFTAGDSQLTAAGATTPGYDLIAAFGTNDVIDLGAFGFTGQASSALAVKGPLANATVDGSQLSQTDFFVSGGVARGVAVGENNGNTYVFIDVDHDGSFNASTDLFVELTGITTVALSNFGF